MAITEKDLPKLLEFIGISDVKDVEDFNKKFAEKWHTAETFFESPDFKAYVGKLNGSLTSKIKGIAKTFGIDYQGKDIEGKSTEDIIQMGFEKLQEANNSVLESERAKSKGNKDERYTELEGKLAKLQGDYTNLEGINKTLKSDFEGKEKAFGEKLKGEKLSFRKKDLFANYKWGKEVDDLRKKGFMATIEEKAKFDLDEQDNLIVIDAKTGNKFANPSKHSSFLSPEEFLMKEGIDAKVYAVNPDAGKPAGGNGQWKGIQTGQNGSSAPEGGKQGNVLAINTYQ